jgi:hypothetical protein
MKTITLQLELSTEQEAALDAKIQARNASGGDYTITSHLEEVLSGEVQNTTLEAYNSSVARLGAAAAGLPYEARTALITQLESQLI